MLGYKKPLIKKIRAIKTSNTGILETGTLSLLIPTKTHNEDELRNLRDQLTTQIVIVYADLTGMSKEVFPIASLTVVPFYARELFAKPEYNSGSNLYSGNILGSVCSGIFNVNIVDGEYSLYFQITLNS